MTEPRQIRTLATLDLNEPATVARMKLPEAEVSRLSDLGMRIGSTVRVLQASEGEPLLVAVGDGRIGVNFAVAQKTLCLLRGSLNVSKRTARWLQGQDHRLW